MDKKKLSDQERIALNEKLALNYYGAYKAIAVKDGGEYDLWKFAEGSDYWSPYFGNDTIDLYSSPIAPAASAHFEALSYSIEFPDWTVLDFEYFPAVKGVAWKSHFGGHRKSDGVFMDFFAYSYLRTNEYGEITHWETHVSGSYDDFLDVAIGCHGPFHNTGDYHPYMEAVLKKLRSAGISPESLENFRACPAPEDSEDK